MTLVIAIPNLLLSLGSGSAQAIQLSPEAQGSEDAPDALTPPWRLTKPSQWARVYVDASGSMRGFVGDQAGPYARLLRRLKDFLVDARVLNFEAARFGLRVLAPEKVAAFQKFGTDRSQYGEPDTYLAGVMEDALAWGRDGVVLVLTDGVASVTKFHGGTATPTARTCDRGSDTACLALRINEYVRKGHAFWIVGFRFPFDGPYFVEEGGPGAPAGTRLEVKVPDRPLYVWVGGSDVAQGQALVRDLTRFAREAKPPIPSFAIEVAPGRWDRWEVPPDLTVEEAGLPPKEFCARGGALLKTLRARDTAAVMEVATRDKGSFAIRLPVRNPDDPTGFNTEGVIPLLLLKQELALDLRAGLRADSVSLSWALHPYRGVKKGRWQYLDLCLTGRPPLGLLGKDVGVVARWKAERSLAPDQPWEAWSTDSDDTPRAARQTVNLSVFFRHLLSQMLPEVGPKSQEPMRREPFARVLYRK